MTGRSSDGGGVEVDFAMPYPCFFLKKDSGGYECLVSEGERCICLFTDQDLGVSYYKDKYGGNFSTRTVTVTACEDDEALINTLEEWQPQLAGQGITHVAIDPTAGKLVGRVALRELIEDLKRQQ